MPKANIIYVVLTLCLISLFFLETSYSTEQVVIEFFYIDPSQVKVCPSCQARIIDALILVDEIELEYGDQVKVERWDTMTAEGLQRYNQYSCTREPTVVINHTIKLEWQQINRENLKTVIDQYLAGGGSDSNSFQPPSLTIISAFSLGFFETFSPCLIAMLSFILSYTVGETILFREGVLRVMTFGTGFVSAAVFLGAAVALTLSSMPNIQVALILIVCVFVILFGLNLLGLLKVPIQTKPLVKKLAGKYATTYVGLLLLGFIFYFLDPCIAPFAFTMLMMLQNVEFILPLLMFCLGAIIPFIGIGILAGYASKLARSTYRHRSKIRGVSGLILIVYALYLITLYFL